MDFLDNLERIVQEKIEKENNISIKNDQGARPLSREEMELANKLDAVEVFTVDRIEGDFVVLEDRKKCVMVNVKRDVLPEGLKEGDVLKKVNGKYFVDDILTQEIANRIRKKMDDLWN